MGIVASKGGYQGQWVWQYPFSSLDEGSIDNSAKITKHPIDAQPHGMSIFEETRSSLTDKEEV